MGLATTFVPLHKVKPTASRWNFPEADLEAAAQLVLAVEGIVNPIVIRRETNSDAYAVLDGNFEYYAVARAHQIDAQRCTAIEAFVVESRDEAVIQKQLALFRRPAGNSSLPDWRYHLGLDQSNLERSDLDQSNLERSSTRDDPEQPFEQSSRWSIEPTLQTGQLLHVFNQSSAEQLLLRVKRIGLTGRNAEKVVEAIEQERRQQPFHSLKEVVNRIKGLSYEKMIDLVEAEG
jgi:hypothetical protein